MAIEISNQAVITASTNITVDSAKPGFNFIFNQQYGYANLTIISIDGFTSNPSFTPTSNAFIFNSKGSPIGTITFSYTATSPVAITLTSELTQNDVVIQSFSEQIIIQRTFTFSPIIVGVGDTIQIRTYFAD
jgi:hypothetical protein